MTKTLILLIFILLVIVLFLWSMIKLYYVVKKEASSESRWHRKNKQEAEIALLELDKTLDILDRKEYELVVRKD